MKKPFHLIVFFTFGVSLKVWSDTGLIGRELLLYKKMVKDGNRVSLLTYGDKKDYMYSDQLEGIEVFPVYESFPKSRNKVINLILSFFIPFKFMQVLKTADFLKTNQMFGAWVPVMVAYFFRKPLVVRCGFEMLRNLLRDENNKMIWIMKAVLGYLLEFMAYMSAKKIIISNGSDLNYIRSIFPVKKEKMLLIRNFIDTDLFSPRSCTSQQATSGQNRLKMLFIGRLDDNRKNVKNLITATGKSNCHLSIIGSGRLKDDFVMQAQQENTRVNFSGMVDNRQIPKIIHEHDIFILPSFYENNPKTLLEAMSSGKICIGTNVEGINELIEDGATGYLCETDFTSIAETISKIIQTDKHVLGKIAENARRFIINECSIERVYKKEMELYN